MICVGKNAELSWCKLSVFVKRWIAQKRAQDCLRSSFVKCLFFSGLCFIINRLITKLMSVVFSATRVRYWPLSFCPQGVKELTNPTSNQRTYQSFTLRLFDSWLNLNCSLGGRQSFQIGAVFRVSRSGEAERLANCGVPGNHRLLWHGTKTANMMGILQQGLRIAPPEASRSGWSLGKVCDGVIFANLQT